MISQYILWQCIWGRLNDKGLNEKKLSEFYLRKAKKERKEIHLILKLNLQNYSVLFVRGLSLSPTRWHSNKLYKRKGYKLFSLFYALSLTACSSDKMDFVLPGRHSPGKLDSQFQTNHVVHSHTQQLII